MEPKPFVCMFTYGVGDNNKVGKNYIKETENNIDLTLGTYRQVITTFLPYSSVFDTASQVYIDKIISFINRGYRVCGSPCGTKHIF